MVLSDVFREVKYWWIGGLGPGGLDSDWIHEHERDCYERGIPIWIPNHRDPNHQLPSGKLTWQWKITLLKMYSLLKMGIFHCYVSLLEGNHQLRKVSGNEKILHESGLRTKISHGSDRRGKRFVYTEMCDSPRDSGGKDDIYIYICLGEGDFFGCVFFISGFILFLIFGCRIHDKMVS